MDKRTREFKKRTNNEAMNLFLEDLKLYWKATSPHEMEKLLDFMSRYLREMDDESIVYLNKNFPEVISKILNNIK